MTPFRHPQPRQARAAAVCHAQLPVPASLPGRIRTEAWRTHLRAHELLFKNKVTVETNKTINTISLTSYTYKTLYQLTQLMFDAPRRRRDRDEPRGADDRGQVLQHLPRRVSIIIQLQIHIPNYVLLVGYQLPQLKSPPVICCFQQYNVLCWQKCCSSKHIPTLESPASASPAALSGVPLRSRARLACAATIVGGQCGCMLLVVALSQGQHHVCRGPSLLILCRN